MSDSPTPAIELDAVTKRFKNKLAVNSLSLRLNEGQVLGLLGPNGAGKSTMMKMMMGLLAPDAGEVRVLGESVMIDPLRVRQHIGYVPENHFIYRWMRAGEVVEFCRAFYERWNNDLAGDLMKRFGLDPTQRVQHLSKGMVTKLALILALAHEPDVLILDEPMAGLDALVREELVEGVLQELSDRGRTVLISSHTFSDVHRLADEIAIINEGRLLVQMPTSELLTGTKRIRAVLRNGIQPSWRPASMVCERTQGREWLVTVGRFDPQMLEGAKRLNEVEHFEVLDLGLEEIFKDYIRGARGCQQETAR